MINGTGKSGQTTIPFPAVMVKLAPKMTTVLRVSVLVHRSDAFIVNIVAMTNVGQNLDIVRFTRTSFKGFSTAEIENATPKGICTQKIHARFVPNIRTTFNSGAPARAKCARSGAPWVRKFGKLSIQENLVMT